MDISAKLQDFENSLSRIANEDYNKIEKKVEDEISAGIEQELAEYEAKKQIAYDKSIQKIEKEYNKKIFNYEMNCKKKIIDEEKKLRIELKNEAINILKEFTKKADYEQYLLKCIKERSIKNRCRKYLYWFNETRYR